MSEVEKSVRRLVERTGIPLKKLAEGLGVPASEILSWRAGGSLRIRERQVLRLAQYLGINPEGLVDGTFDENLIRRRVIEGPGALPDHYMIEAQSRVRTSAHIIDFLKSFYGQEFTDRLLFRMNVHPCYFDELDNTISLQFLTDLFAELRKLGYSLSQLQSLGHMLAIFLRGTPLGTQLSQARSYESLYAQTFSNIDRFDRNFHYKAKMMDKGILIEVSPASHTIQMLENKPNRSEILRDLFFYRQAILERFPFLTDTPYVEVIPQKAVYEGDKFDRYWLKYPDKGTLNQAARKRRAPSPFSIV